MRLSPYSYAGMLFVLCLVLLVSVPRVHSQELDCLIEPFVTVKVSSAVNGLLETVTVDRGDLVKKARYLPRSSLALKRRLLKCYAPGRRWSRPSRLARRVSS